MLACKINKPKLNVAVFGSYTCYWQERSFSWQRRATVRSGASLDREERLAGAALLLKEKRDRGGGALDRDITVVRQQTRALPRCTCGCRQWHQPPSLLLVPLRRRFLWPPLRAVQLLLLRYDLNLKMYNYQHHLCIISSIQTNKNWAHQLPIHMTGFMTGTNFNLTYISSLLGALMHQNHYWE
jgi:hypothetical protein